MSQTYLEIARQGRNNWWRYLLGILLILFFWFIVGSVVTILLIIPLAGGLDVLSSQRQLLNFLQTRSVINYVIVNISFIFFLLGIFLAIKFLHGRKLLSLVNGEAKINFQRVLLGLGVWFLIDSVFTVVTFILQPDNIEFAFKASEWFILLAVALVLTPLQTSTEELFFRGYILQGLGLVTKQPLVLMIINGIVFMIPHLANPEIQRGVASMALFYFAFGVFCTFVTLKDNRLELVLGIHAANNLFHIFISTKDSALPVPAIWFVKNPGEPQWSLMFFLIECGLFYLIVFGKRKKRRGTLSEAAESELKIK